MLAEVEIACRGDEGNGAGDQVLPVDSLEAACIGAEIGGGALEDDVAPVRAKARQRTSVIGLAVT